jgi:MATE family multidrug resistance protein
MSERGFRAIFKELFVLALPIVISQGAYAFMIFTDRYFMAQISAQHISASMSGGVTSFVTLSLFLGIISYANAMVAQFSGAERLHKCSRVVTQGFVLSVIAFPLLLLLTIPVTELFSWVGHTEELVALESAYYQVLIYGGVFSLAKAALSSFFSGIGRSWVVMVCDVTGVFINIALSYALVFGHWGLPALGITGAALGTVISTAITLVLFLLFYLSPSIATVYGVAQSWIVDMAILRKFVRYGFPSGLESFMNVVTFNLFMLMFQNYGVREGAAMAIVFNWDLLSFISMIGLHIAVMSLAGRYIGSGESHNLNRVIAAGFSIALSVTVIFAITFATLAATLVGIFDTGAEDFEQISVLAQAMMLGLACYVIADGINLVASGVLRGAGDTRWLMFASVSVHWGMLVAQVFIIKVWQLGPMASWWTFVAMLMCLAALYLGRLAWGSWRSPERLAKLLENH